jgi:hypothetical protein
MLMMLQRLPMRFAPTKTEQQQLDLMLNRIDAPRIALGPAATPTASTGRDT